MATDGDEMPTESERQRARRYTFTAEPQSLTKPLFYHLIRYSLKTVVNQSLGINFNTVGWPLLSLFLFASLPLHTQYTHAVLSFITR